ncbi:MAG: hypothetical protein ACRC2T_14535 [Thermoguttaceae bacterium]
MLQRKVQIRAKWSTKLFNKCSICGSLFFFNATFLKNCAMRVTANSHKCEFAVTGDCILFGDKTEVFYPFCEEFAFPVIDA